MKAQDIWKEIDQEEDGEEMDSGAVEDAADKVGILYSWISVKRRRKL